MYQNSTIPSVNSGTAELGRKTALSKLNLLNNQYQQKQKDYQDLKTETLRAIRGINHLNVNLLNSVAEEPLGQIKELEQQAKQMKAELRELVSGAKQAKEKYTRPMNLTELYDQCTFEAKKMIEAQFIKAVHVK